MTFQKILLACLFLPFQFLFGQSFTLSGRIKGDNENLAFATVLVKGSSIGCTSNSEGLFVLKLPKGEYEIEFHYLGYNKHIEKIFLNKNTNINIELQSEGIQLKEIEIKAGEDPSYSIIRKSIQKRNYYYHQIETYSCKTYIKGFQKVVELPKNFDKMLKLFGGRTTDTNQLKGIIYLSESESNFYYKQPDQINEVMFSSKVSGNSQSFSFNKLSDMNINFNKNLVDIRGLSDRPLISPINNNAFFYYKYILLGVDSNDLHNIYKIKVIPKRDTDPCFKGIIYIQDSCWRITGADMKLNKANKLKFVDTLYIKQVQASVLGDSIWMPVNLNLSFDFKILGIKGYGYFNAHLKDYAFNVNQNSTQNKNELLNISNEASSKDSAYWNQNRPMPLTEEEKLDYRQKDSLKVLMMTRRYQDSIDRINNKLQWIHFISGYTYRNTEKKIKISLPPLVNNGIQYNTVEGLNLSYQFNLEKTYQNFDKTEIDGKVRYGFANFLWGGELGWQYFLEPVHFTRFGIKIKSMVEQYNHQAPISPLINSLYTLLINDNYMKLFKETGVETNYFTELINGLYFSSNIKYLQRDPLLNKTNLLIIDNIHKAFTSNDPEHFTTHDSMFTSNQAFTAEISLSIRFRQKYYMLPHQKIIVGSKYPKLSMSYKRAVPIFNSDANFDLLIASLHDDIRLGLIGKFAYRIRGGKFLQTKKIYFADYKHFLGNQTIANSNDYLNSFRMLPYYTYSADKWFIEAHAEHHFRGFLFNKIPLFKKLAVQEIIGAHFLKNNKLNQAYYEINFGLERIFKIIRFDYVLSYNEQLKVKSGITFGLTLSL